MTRRLLLMVATTAIAAAAAGSAVAQIVPAHPPGTICFTQTFWCWAQPPGPPGTACGCSTAGGMVQGVRG